MPSAPDPWLAFIETAAPVVGLEIADAWKPGVALYLEMAANAAALFAELPLDDAADEAAPVFHPGLRP